MIGLFRRVNAFRTVMSGAEAHPIAQSDFVAKAQLYRQQAVHAHHPSSHLSFLSVLPPSSSLLSRARARARPLTHPSGSEDSSFLFSLLSRARARARARPLAHPSGSEDSSFLFLLISHLSSLQSSASSLQSFSRLPRIVAALWKTEGLATTLAKFPLPENTLDDARLGLSLPITHVGYGTALAERARFEPDTLHQILATRCDQRHRGFTTEGIGAALRIYEPGRIRSACIRFGLIPGDAAPTPDKYRFFERFFASFSPESQRLIAHGYGRMLAFSHLNVVHAVDEALSLPDNRRLPCVQGIAFAMAMMNSVDFPWLPQFGKMAFAPAVQRAFHEGLVYALVFTDWFADGLLTGWTARSDLEAQLCDRARAEVAQAKKRGVLLPFALMQA